VIGWSKEQALLLGLLLQEKNRSICRGGQPLGISSATSCQLCHCFAHHSLYMQPQHWGCLPVLQHACHLVPVTIRWRLAQNACLNVEGVPARPTQAPHQLSTSAEEEGRYMEDTDSMPAQHRAANIATSAHAIHKPSRLSGSAADQPCTQAAANAPTALTAHM
jgi:hypothetical protein